MSTSTPSSADPRVALAALTEALERHLSACAVRRGENDPQVVAAYDDVLEAFESYDGALYETYGEMTPLDAYTDDDDQPDEPEDEVTGIDDDTELYAGLDDDIDFDDEAKRR